MEEVWDVDTLISSGNPPPTLQLHVIYDHFIWQQSVSTKITFDHNLVVSCSPVLVSQLISPSPKQKCITGPRPYIRKPLGFKRWQGKHTISCLKSYRTVYNCSWSKAGKIYNFRNKCKKNPRKKRKKQNKNKRKINKT